MCNEHQPEANIAEPFTVAGDLSTLPLHKEMMSR